MVVPVWRRAVVVACLALVPFRLPAQTATELPQLARESGPAAALAEVERRLARRPGDPELRLWQARLLYWLDRSDASAGVLSTLHVERPDDAEVSALLAQVRQAQGDSAGALELYLGLADRKRLPPELRPRLVDLLLEHGAAAKAVAVLGPAPTLDDEQARRWALLTHPWFAQLGTTQTVVRDEVWPRVVADLGQRSSSRLTWLVNFTGEQRFAGSDRQRAWSVAGEAWTALGQWALWLHLQGSPSRGFLPTIDGRIDLEHRLWGPLGAGLQLRAARYDPDASATVPASPSMAWALAPRLVWAVGAWTLEPGYQWTLQAPQAGLVQSLHAGVLKARWQIAPMTAVMAWLTAGQDPTWLERGLTPGRGLTLLAGVDHGWSPRWSTRLSLSRLQPLGDGAPWTEISLSLRTRL